MKRSLFAFVVVLVCALGMASIAVAQSDTYSNNGLTVTVPRGWQAENSPEGGINLGSSDAAMTLLRDSEGQLANTDVAMSIVPPTFLSEARITATDPEQTLSQIMRLLSVTAPITPYTQDGLNGVTAKVRSVAVPSGYAELYALDIDGAIILVLVQVVENSPGAALSQTLLPTIRYEAPAARAERVSGSAIVEGELTNAAPVQTYIVELTAGDVVTIELASVDGAFDAFLSIYAEADYPNGTPLASNDDSGDSAFGTLNSRIADLTILTSGNYIIEATSFSRTGTGVFQLGIGGLNSYTLTPIVVEVPTPVSVSTTVEGELTNAAPVQTYIVELTAGDVVTIELASVDGAFDAFLSIYAEADYPNGTPLASNDDSGDSAFGTLNSRIADLTILTSGNYIIEATSFSRTGTGVFQLGIGGSGTYELVSLNDATATPALAGAATRQWAASATGTSQYGTTSWSFSQATGAPNTNACGDFNTAWASSSSRGQDSLTLTYTTPVIPTQVNIHQTYTPGSIVSVEVGNSRTGQTFVLPNSTDAPGNTPCPGVFTVDVTTVTVPIDTVTIVLDQRIGGNWNEIDAVELVGRAG